MKLSHWAKKNNISYRTAHGWFLSGKLPAEAFRTPSGSIYVKEGHADLIPSQKKAVIYARVSSHDQKDDLTRQVSRLESFSASQGFVISDKVTEIDSGLNGNRLKLMKLLGDREITTIIVEHRDRLARFGFEYIQMALEAAGRSIIVINETEDEMDIVQDFIDVVTSMCARIYGKRGAKNRAERAVKEASGDIT